MTTTDTPRTDADHVTDHACPHCGAGIYALLGLGNETTYWQCGSNPVGKGEVSRSTECYEKELTASQAEVERLKHLLSDLLILTEKNYWNSHNYNQIKKAINQMT